MSHVVVRNSKLEILKIFYLYVQGNESNKGKSRLNSSLEAATILSIRTCVAGNSICVDCNAPSKYKNKNRDN